MVRDKDYLHPFDDRENDESRLPEGEPVHLGGLTLVEAFTPSTVSALQSTTLADWPTNYERETKELLSRLAQSRAERQGAGKASVWSVRPEPS